MIREGIDQRKFPRVSYKCLIRVSKDNKERKIEAFTENIGPGGICVVLEEDFGLFENVELEIFLGTDKKAISCEGTIVWVVKRHPKTQAESVKYDTGIQFFNMAEEDRKSIVNLVNHIMGTET